MGRLFVDHDYIILYYYFCINLFYPEESVNCCPSNLALTYEKIVPNDKSCPISSWTIQIKYHIDHWYWVIVYASMDNFQILGKYEDFTENIWVIAFDILRNNEEITRLTFATF